MMRTRLHVLLIACFLLTTTGLMAQKTKDALNNKTFKVTMTEAKKGKSGKPAQDEIEFRSGKVKCKTLTDPFGFGQIKYELTIDSVYTYEGTETIYIEFEATANDKEGQEVKMTGIIDGYGIEGSLELLDKKGKVKKHYDYVGGEKGGKKPKSNKKKEGEEESGEKP
ncbi:MAG: hypothetical protein FD123_4007 [Bacteroidetes bacterium]|nr:MAG: hypothetical protein FD123_4007 [Bacteroidota bacterium]